MRATSASSPIHEPASGSEPSTICVDLDGTLVVGDIFWESLVALLRRQPLLCLSLPLWAVRGKAYAKQRVARVITLKPEELLYRKEVLDFIKERREQGSTIVLATAADEGVAQAVATHLGLFDSVFASNGQENLKGCRKAAKLASTFGHGTFLYVGNGWADLPVWRAASHPVAVAAPERLRRRLRTTMTMQALGPEPATIQAVVRALRPYQWVKNLLVLVPLLTSHRLLEPDSLLPSVLTLVAFCLCASGVYVANDILDIAADRRHPRKRLRPFASGVLSVPQGVALSLCLTTLALALATFGVSAPTGATLAIYAFVSFLYSIRIKREPIADVFVLSGLYVLRVAAGGIATGIALSSWLLAFALFFFLGLAFLKRYSELVVTDCAPERGYAAGDRQWLHGIGITSGYMAALVLALYVNSSDVSRLYRSPDMLWLICPLLLFWVTRMWFRASRAALTDDPLLEALRDPASSAIGILVITILYAST